MALMLNYSTVPRVLNRKDFESRTVEKETGRLQQAARFIEM